MSKHTEIMVSPLDRNAWNKIAQPLREHMVNCMTGCIDIKDPATTVPELVAVCKSARELYDHLALGPLGAAAKYGPDYEPPTDKDCLEMREALEAILAKTKQHDRQEPRRDLPASEL